MAVDTVSFPTGGSRGRQGLKPPPPIPHSTRAAIEMSPPPPPFPLKLVLKMGNT